MKKTKTRDITLMGLLLAAGLLIPFITSHGLGIPGTVFLPMHIPVFLMGMLCGPFYGAIGGIITPLLSSLLTGMPAVFPMLPIMMCELFVYGFVSGLIYKEKHKNIFASLIIAMILGRAVHGLVFVILMSMSGKGVTVASTLSFIAEGIPGTIIQLILIPILVKALSNILNTEQVHGLDINDEILQNAIELIDSKEFSFVIIKNNEIIYKDSGKGVKPVLKVIDSDKSLLNDAIVVDKIIGKAAALLLVLGNVKGVYGRVMSQSGKDYLKGRGIPINYGRCIQVVSNRTGDGICPLEKSVADIDDPKEAYNILKETIAKLMNKAV